MNGAATSGVYPENKTTEVPQRRFSNERGHLLQAKACPISFRIYFKKMTPQQTKIALRINDDNLNHHLWNNRGVWWCHVTVHKPDATAERLRFSLKTRNIERARRLRDRIFEDIQRHFGIAA